MRRVVMLSLVAVLVLTAVVGTGVVNAQGPSVDVQAPPAPGVGWGGAFQQRGGPGQPHRWTGDRGQWLALRIIADTLGMSQQDLIAELRTGKTVAEVAQAQGVDLTTVVDALLAPRAERLQQAVDNGRLTQEQADALLVLARIRTEDRLQQPYRLSPLMIAAQVLGMEPPELLAELRTGKSVAEVAAERGVALDEIVDAIVAPKADRLSELVAAGRLTQEQADILIALERDRVTRMLEWHKAPPGRGPGHGPRGRGFRFGDG